MNPPTSAIESGHVAIVVATHRYCYPLERCLSTHQRLLQNPADLIFVDNGSAGEMTRWAADRFPEITILTREQNGYFCGGYNTGLQYAMDKGYRFVLIVNADTDVCNADYLKSLVEAARRHPQAAFLGPRVFLRKIGQVQNTILRYPWFSRHLSHWLTSRIRPSNRSASASADTVVDFLNGVCVLCRVDALRDVGLLDETMGGYVEDTDWSWRARQCGWHSVFVPVPGIVHHQAADEYEHYSMKTFMLRRNHVYWHMKAGHRWQARLFAEFSLLLARLRAIRAVLKGQQADEHRQYVVAYARVMRRILSEEPPGEWFGPPVGQGRDLVS